MNSGSLPAAALPAPPGDPWLERNLKHVSILVVDDEMGIRNFVVKLLAPLCKKVEEAESAEEASKLLDAQHFDIVILDNVMPGISGLDWLAEQRKVGLFADTILMTAYADLETAIHALRVGAIDLVLKPFRSNQILNAVRRAVDQRFLKRENTLLKYELRIGSEAARGRLLGRSPRIEAVRSILQKAAHLPTPILLTGESGTGKEVAARTLHALSDRAEKPFVPINCAHFGAESAMAELFGMVSADRDGKLGLLALANGGTLFLDEVADMRLEVQAMLLRVIEEGRIRPIGSDREMPLNLRFICATNSDLERAVAEGRFRKDLFHRINVLAVHMPPLRERVGDIDELADMFMGKLSRELGVPPIPLTEDIALGLARYDWPGNVRELRNLIERSLILGAFPPEFVARHGQGARITEFEPVESLLVMERRHILSVLEACQGNRAEAARRLGISRKTIDRKCASWDV